MRPEMALILPPAPMLPAAAGVWLAAAVLIRTTPSRVPSPTSPLPLHGSRSGLNLAIVIAGLTVVGRLVPGTIVDIRPFASDGIIGVGR